MAKKNLSGSYADNEVTIIGNDLRHVNRKEDTNKKRKMRNLDVKPDENVIRPWSAKKKVFWVFAFITFTTLVVYVLDNIIINTPI